ncbi:MAG: RNA polymerase sigma-70 factor [Prevotella sp.]
MTDLTEDEMLLVALTNGNERAFDLIFVKYYARIKGFVLDLCGNEDVAENTTQEIFMNMWIHRDIFARVHSLKSYIFMMARNAAYREIKKSMRTLHAIGLEETIEDSSVSIVDEMAYQELEALIKQEVEKMPEQRRRVFKMSRWEGLSNQEIATKLGIGKRTVETHISLALADLHKILSLFLVLTLINGG